MYKRILIFSFSCCLFFAGCIEELDLEHLRPEPKLVLNSVAMAGLPVTAMVSRTYFIADIREYMILPDAEVSLYVNGQEQGPMIWSGAYYLSSYLPESGDQITVKVKAEGFPDAEASTHIPFQAHIDTITWETKEIASVDYVFYNDTPYIETYTHYTNTFKVSFQDDPDESNFYFLIFEKGYPIVDPEKKYTGEYYWYHCFLNYAEDPLFAAEITALDRIFYGTWLSGYGRAFSDQLINGKNYTFHLVDDELFVSNGYTPYNPDSYLQEIPEEERLPVLGRFSLYTLSESFYSYVKSVTGLEEERFINDLIKAGLAEPTRVYNNVTGGLGILGGCCPYSKTFILKDLSVSLIPDP